MSTYNPGLLYYKHYYNDITFGDEAKKTTVEQQNAKLFRDCNKVLKSTRFQPVILPALSVALPTDSANKATYFQVFELTTTYPGLILGTGYTHGSNLLGEFKTGFFFDHTTGMPLIPGSSVKGLLRSAFPALYYEQAEKFREKGKQEEEKFWQKLGDNRSKFITALLKALAFRQDADKAYVQQLEREIFEGMHGTNREKEDHHFPMRDRDIFFDAVVVRSKDQQIFEEDYITPHKNPLKNPIPIQLLKVKPEVTFQFQFRLQAGFHTENGVKERLLTPAQRLELFRQILLFLGAGAKTNTGYGQFRAEQRKVQLETTTEKKEETAPAVILHTPTEPANYEGNISKGAQLQAKIIALSPKKKAQILVKNVPMEVNASGNCPEVGTICMMTISDFDKSKKITMLSYAGPVDM